MKVYKVTIGIPFASTGLLIDRSLLPGNTGFHDWCSMC